MGEPSWEFLSKSSPSPRRARSRRQRWPRWVYVVAAEVVLLAALVAWRVWDAKQKASLEILPIPDMEVSTRETLEHTVAVRASAPQTQWRFSLDQPPPGAHIDPQTGRFLWKPAERRAAGKYRLIVRVAAGDLSAQRSFRVNVLPNVDRPHKPAGEKPAAETEFAQDTPLHPAENAPAEQTPATQPATSPPPVQAPSQANQPLAAESKADDGDQVLIDLYRKHSILLKPSYPAIRRVFAKRFEREHEEAIRAAFGEKSVGFRKWLDDRSEIKEEFYLAIDPQHDDIPQALKLFRTLYDRFPGQFEDYASLAIATSVVWDREGGAIHGSPVDSAVATAHGFDLDALGNFQYYIESPPAIECRARYLPWEFLVYVVNHRTTLPERKWAQVKYLPKQSMIGRCYGDVPYDGDMLKGEPAKIEGKVYHFPNLYCYGGVCRHQADYATRVAKSLGVPAFTAGAATNLGEGHAWVMWAELGPVTRTGFQFSLESCGRYQGAKFYVGGLSDPHTGQPATDREVQLRLHTIGSDTVAKRQADLVMRAYPMLREKLALDLPQQLNFLGRIVKYCPGNEDVWHTLAKLSREGQITKVNHRPMQRIIEDMFIMFRDFPDFTWVVFDDMVYFEDRPLRKADLYARLAGMYEQAGRIDLSCKARLKHADILVSNGQRREAAASLAAGILLFPDEGRYVPLLLDKLEAICHKEKAGQQQLVLFYQQFLPKVPQPDGKNEYGVAMFKRGVECFRKAGQEQLAEAARKQLRLMEEREPSKKKDGRSLLDVIE
jgi:hypothetical protein